MTVSKINPVNNYAGDSSVTRFDFDFLIEKSEELLVQHTNSLGVQTTLTLDVDYSINEIGNKNGSYINFPLAGSSYSVLAEDEIISLSLELDIEQDKEYANSSKLNLTTLEWSLDYIIRILQTMSRKIARSVKVQEGSTQTADELVEALQEAQINAANSAAAAATSATQADTSATSAQQFADDAEETYNNTVAKYDEVVVTVETEKTNITTLSTEQQSAITTLTDSALDNISGLTDDFNTNAANKTTSLETQYNTESNNLQNQYNNYTQNLGNEYQATMKAYDRLYEGVDLEVKFADEIAQYASVYDWLEARKNADNYDGIHIGDYFHTSISAHSNIGGYNIAAQNFTCRIVGLDTYKSCGDTPIGHMIYVISDQCIDTPILWNPEANNNGTSVEEHPYLASAVYGVLNGVNNYSTSAYQNKAHGIKNTNGGIIGLLPAALQNVLKQKRNILDKRYSASGLLTGGTGWDWLDMGKLWLPNEVEVYGAQFKSNTCLTSGWWNPENNLSIQFAWFANNCEHRVKRKSNGDRCYWWLSSVASHNSTSACYVNNSGFANSTSATSATICVPLCFCI